MNRPYHVWNHEDPVAYHAEILPSKGDGSTAKGRTCGLGRTAWTAFGCGCTCEDASEVADRGEMSLYANGFRFKCDDEAWDSPPLDVVLSPFSFARRVSMQSAVLADAISPSPVSRILAVSLYLQGRAHFFGIGGKDENQVEELCNRWVADLALSIRWVTESLFTRGSCFQTRPAAVSGRASERLMAGYILHGDDGCRAPSAIRLLYAELYPPREGKARLLLHEDTLTLESSPWQELLIEGRTPSFDKVGHDCSCFCVGTLQLSARTVFERQLWLRAVSNVKVKLQSRGADPGQEDLEMWRDAINTHIGENAAKLRNRLCITHLTDRSREDNGTNFELEAAADILRLVPLLRRCTLAAGSVAGSKPRPPSSDEGREKATGMAVDPCRISKQAIVVHC